MTAARELGYRPNPAARSLRTGTTRTIGFLSDGVTVHRYASGMLRGVLQEAAATKHVVLIAESDGDLDSIARTVAVMNERRVDALVVGLMAARRVQLSLPSIPAVMVNGALAGQTHTPTILPDEYRGGRTAARRLIAAGHTRIGVIGRFLTKPGPEISLTIGDRFRGIDAELKQTGVHSVFEFAGSEWEPQLGAAAAEAFFNGAGHGTYHDPNGATAIIAANDRVAFGFHQAALTRGYRIPADCSLISFDNEDLAGYLSPGLSTVALPYEEMGSAAVRALTGASHGDQRIPMPLVERQSVGAPRTQP